MNKLILIGNLTKDPEVFTTPTEVIYCKLTIAVTRPYSSSGDKHTDYFTVTVWRGQAENCNRYLKKGSKVAVTASLRNKSYTDNNGVKRATNEIIAESVEFLSTSKNSAQGANTEPVLTNISEDDIMTALDTDMDDCPY